MLCFLFLVEPRLGDAYALFHPVDGCINGKHHRSLTLLREGDGLYYSWVSFIYDSNRDVVLVGFEALHLKRLPEYGCLRPGVIGLVRTVSWGSTALRWSAVRTTLRTLKVQSLIIKVPRFTTWMDNASTCRRRVSISRTARRCWWNEAIDNIYYRGTLSLDHNTHLRIMQI